MIPDRLFYPLAALIVAALVGLAFAWPIGQGAPKPSLPPALAAKMAGK